MEIKLKEMKKGDRKSVTDMMRVFYDSPAVSSSGSEEIFKRDFDACLDPAEPLEGYLICNENEEVLGYTMLAHTYSTEFGRPCLFIEDLYIRPGYRDQHAGSRVLQKIKENHPNTVIKLEVEDANQHAIHTYDRNGFRDLPYKIMTVLPD